jgi:hypothetical protein
VQYFIFERNAVPASDHHVRTLSKLQLVHSQRVNRPAPILPSGHSSRNRFGQSAATHGRWRWPINRNEARHHTTTRAYAEQATGITATSTCQARALELNRSIQQYFLVCVRRRAETNLPRSITRRAAVSTRSTSLHADGHETLRRHACRLVSFYAPCAESGRAGVEEVPGQHVQPQLTR